MQKIISVFQRNYDGDRLIRDEVVPGAEWVLAGEGLATRKFDGSCCMVKGGELYKRYDAKNGKPLPEGFIPEQDPDPITRHHPGWLKVGEVPEDMWFRAAWANVFQHNGGVAPPDSTYEAVGPHFQGNPERFEWDTLVRHGVERLPYFHRDFLGMRSYLESLDIEGIVFHHPDGRMAKVKKKDFGLKRV